MCTPGEQRCTDALSVQTCELNGEWAAASTTCVDQACSQGKCVSSAPPTTTCQMGQSPDWWSSEADGGNTSLDDPRWGAAPIVPFESTFGFNPGGYIVLLDRAAGRLSVSIRVTMGPAELPAPDDYIYFGATPNVADAPAARSVTVPLRAMMAGDDATPISTFQSSVYTTTWQSGNKADWAQNIAAWRGGPDDGFSWAVNLVVDLTRVGIDVSKPFRVALAIHAEGSTQDLTVPANTGGLILTPSGWAAATITASGCVERVALQ